MLKSILAGLTLTTMLAASASAQQITVYTAGPAGLAKNLATGFEKQTGVKVNVFQATTGQIMARLTAERANPQADVLISASWETAVDLKAAGQLLARARLEFLAGDYDLVLADLKAALLQNPPRPLAQEATLLLAQSAFARGSYSFLAVGSTLADRDTLAARQGSLFFAGEACSRDHAATVHGAFTSGERAANAIVTG